MFTRLLKKPSNSILLLGPRGTGKSTWIKANFKDNVVYDLLNTQEVLRFSRNPTLLYQELRQLPEGTFIIIDEIQKVPELLNEVHRLMEDHRLNFVLSGSSARKLKKRSTNLLAGRAIVEHMFPLVSAEVGAGLDLKKAIRFGMLPMAYTSNDPQSYLTSYAEVYLQEEIKNEALTRNIGSFARFLEVAARQNGQLTSVTAISRDAQVARQTVQGFFDILIDTLVGFWLNPWKLKRSTKQVSHPKFYFFDSGVVGALSGRLPYPPNTEETGHLFETIILNEIRAYIEYSGLHYPIFFWRSHNGVEVDVLIETTKGFVAIEIKSASEWRSSFNKGLARIENELGKDKVHCLGIYLGERVARFGNTDVIPASLFLQRLWNGEIIV